MKRDKLIEDVNAYLDAIEQTGEMEIGNFMFLGVMHRVNDPAKAAAFLITHEDEELKRLTAQHTNGIMSSPGGFIGDLPTSLRILVIHAVNRYTMGLATDAQKREDFPVHAGGIIQLS